MPSLSGERGVALEVARPLPGVGAAVVGLDLYEHALPRVRSVRDPEARVTAIVDRIAQGRRRTRNG